MSVFAARSGIGFPFSSRAQSVSIQCRLTVRETSAVEAWASVSGGAETVPTMTSPPFF
jgi:hypothetical protein